MGVACRIRHTQELSPQWRQIISSTRQYAKRVGLFLCDGVLSNLHHGRPISSWRIAPLASATRPVSATMPVVRCISTHDIPSGLPVHAPAGRSISMPPHTRRTRRPNGHALLSRAKQDAAVDQTSRSSFLSGIEQHRQHIPQVGPVFVHYCDSSAPHEELSLAIRSN